MPITILSLYFNIILLFLILIFLSFNYADTWSTKTFVEFYLCGCGVSESLQFVSFEYNVKYGYEKIFFEREKDLFILLWNVVNP